MDTEIANIVTRYNAGKLVQYFGAVANVAVMADYFHTLPDEVRLMWPTPLSAPKVLFFLLRYYLLIHRAPLFFLELPSHFTPETCKVALSWALSSCLFVVIVSEALLFIRVYAFSGRNRKLCVFLSMVFIVIHGTGIGLLILFLNSSKFAPDPPGLNLPCSSSQSDATQEFLGGVFTSVLLSLLLVMGIMAYLAYQRHRYSRSGLFTVFYRDGVLYFVLLSMFAAVNIVITFSPVNGPYKLILGQAEIDLHGVLATRMILHLRRWAERDVQKQRQLGESEMEMQCHPISNRQYTTRRRDDYLVTSPIRFDKPDTQATLSVQ